MTTHQQGDWRMQPTYQRPDGSWLWTLSENWHLNDNPDDPDNWVAVGQALDPASRADLARVAAQAAGDSFPTAQRLDVASRYIATLEAQLTTYQALLEEACFHVTVERDEHSIDQCSHCDLFARIEALLPTRTPAAQGKDSTMPEHQLPAQQHQAALLAEVVTLLADLRTFVPGERRGYYLPLIDRLTQQLIAAQEKPTP